MHFFLKFVIVVCFTSSITIVNAQQAVPTANVGSVKGLLQDTVHKYTVKSATVSVYRADSSLLNYQLSNSYGEFNFKSLPPGKFYVEVSHINYQLLRRGFSINAQQSTVDLKALILQPKDFTLKEVAIKAPPIVMNGDTLEFNAAAFRLDSNAVVEDLLRKIPNVTLWGDGKITVNGKEVKSLLVNGKEFFGGDIKMATQNISKNAVQKVQVYNQRNESNPLDSNLTMNLKLKKGKDKGHFGKIGGGYGTTERFEADGNVNLFTPKMQLGVIAAGNNTNKIANDIRTLTANSTFKGTGLDVDYQPNFRSTGITQTNTGGATFSYNFVEKPTYNNKKTISANYFIQNRNNDRISSGQTVTTLGTGSTLFENTSSNNRTVSTNHAFDTRLEYNSSIHNLTISQKLGINSGENNSQSVRRSSNGSDDLISTNTVEGWNHFNNKNFNLSAYYRYNNYRNYRKKIRSFNTSYNIAVNQNKNDRIDLTEFKVFANAAENRDFNRKYMNNSTTINQNLLTEVPELKRLFFGNRRLAGINFNVQNEVSLSNLANNNEVGDFSYTTNSYSGNSYLSNNLRTNTLTEAPSLTLLKSYGKSLSNRFSRNLNIEVSFKQKFAYQSNQSDEAIQNISRRYSNFLPGASIRYNRYQYGEYSNDLSISYNREVTIPTVEELVPLIDSANVYRLQLGNINLKEAKRNDIRLNFGHYDQRSKNTLSYSVNGFLNFTNDFFAESMFIDKANRRTIYLANTDGYKSASLNAELRKALKFKANVLQVTIGGTMSFSKTPGYLNNIFSYSTNNNSNSNLSFNYRFKDKLALETKESFSYYRSRQNAFNSQYSGKNLTTAFSGSYNLNKKLTINSNIDFNTNKSSAGKPVNYNIWNASTVFRFLKGNNAELKLTALDLLRQNNSIINTGNANGYTFGTRNVLQQYFMTTFSYYPRQFGKKPGTK